MNILTSYRVDSRDFDISLSEKKKKKNQKIQPRLLILFQEKILLSFAMFTLFHLNPNKNYWEKN